MVVFWPSKVKKELLKLDINKASGPDDVPGLVMKMVAPELATPLARLFQTCFDKGYMLAQWKYAHVIPCYKKGENTHTWKLQAHLSAAYTVCPRKNG